ncbi:MAG: hypothetical protein RSG77_19825 [Hafnia sp.]
MQNVIEKYECARVCPVPMNLQMCFILAIEAGIDSGVPVPQILTKFASLPDNTVDHSTKSVLLHMRDDLSIGSPINQVLVKSGIFSEEVSAIFTAVEEINIALATSIRMLKFIRR